MPSKELIRFLPITLLGLHLPQSLSIHLVSPLDRGLLVGAASSFLAWIFRMQSLLAGLKRCTRNQIKTIQANSVVYELAFVADAAAS
jgi:hypothetical protein